MKRIVSLATAGLVVALAASAVAAQASTRPDDQPNHGIGLLQIEQQWADIQASKRPDDQANHGIGLLALDEKGLAGSETTTFPPRSEGVFAGSTSDSATALPPRSEGTFVDSTPSSPSARVASGERFDWLDAGIGGLAAFGAVMLLAGASILALRHQRTAAHS